MKSYSTREAARKLGITGVALGRYIKQGKLSPPMQTLMVSGKAVHAWTEAEIEHVRQLLPKIANGRKTRYKKKQSAPSSPGTHGTGQQSIKAKGKTTSKKKK
jgi:hypothetical protein